MLDYEQQRKLIIVFILAVILLVILTIVALVFIWTPDKESEAKYEVGRVASVNVDDNAILMKHFNTMSKLFLNEDIDAISSLVGKDYLEYNDHSIQDVKNYLREKNILGKRLELVNSAIYSVPGYNNVFYLDMKAEGEVYSLDIVVREISPEDYTISFEKFIEYKEQAYSKNVSSVQLNVLSVARFVNSVEYRVRIANNYDKQIEINSLNEANSLLLASKDGTIKTPIISTMPIQSMKMQPRYSREFNVTYNIDSNSDFSKYNIFVLKGVSYLGMNGTSNLEFYM